METKLKKLKVKDINKILISLGNYNIDNWPFSILKLNKESKINFIIKNFNENKIKELIN